MFRSTATLNHSKTLRALLACALAACLGVAALGATGCAGQGTQGSYDGMTGADAVSHWAAPAMRWAVGSGILRGDETGNLNPGGTATRGQVAQMLMNFVQLITK